MNLAGGICLRFYQKSSWADAVTSAQPHTIPDSCVSERISAVDKASSLSNEGKSSSALVAWMARLLNDFGHRLFADADATARQHGWQVTQLSGGLGRRYRDPRFDSLVRCPSCLGMGDVDAVRCEPCGGTGRLTLYEPAPVPEGAGDA